MFKISLLQDRPIDLIQLKEIREVVRHGWIGVLICENELDTMRRHIRQAGNENDNLLVRDLLNAISSPDVEHHDRVRGEVERDVVTK